MNLLFFITPTMIHESSVDNQISVCTCSKNPGYFFRAMLMMVILAGLSYPSCITNSPNTPVVIKVERDQVFMGNTVKVEAIIKQASGDQMILLPYVNGRRWGAHEFADADGRATFLIPLPNPGPAMIQVIAMPSDPDHWQGLADFDLIRTQPYMPEG
ncbi:hypothetical protein KA005_64875, partial [bacterium]|nr:hypothetical protein [bacterium]